MRKSAAQTNLFNRGKCTKDISKRVPLLFQWLLNWLEWRRRRYFCEATVWLNVGRCLRVAHRRSFFFSNPIPDIIIDVCCHHAIMNLGLGGRHTVLSKNPYHIRESYGSYEWRRRSPTRTEEKKTTTKMKYVGESKMSYFVNPLLFGESITFVKHSRERRIRIHVSPPWLWLIEDGETGAHN